MNTNNITIKKATLTAGHGLSLEMSERQKDGTYVDSKSEYSAAVHPDLNEAFRRANIHLGLAAEHLSSDQVKDIDSPEDTLLEKYKVASISFLADEEGVKLSGTVELTTGKKMGLTPPTIKWDDDPAYGYSSELAEISALILAEVKSYLTGKHAPDPQQEIGFPEEAQAN